MSDNKSKPDSEEEAYATIHHIRKENPVNKFNKSIIRISTVAFLILIAALMILQGCAVPDKQIIINLEASADHYQNFDPDLHTMIQRYEAHLKRIGSKLNVDRLNSAKLVEKIKVYNEEGELITNVIGVCFSGISGERIEINADYWWSSHRVQAEALGFHELEHCVRHISHRSALLVGNCPSIMNPYISSYATLIRCWSVAIEELFAPLPSLTLRDDDCYSLSNGDTACLIKELTDEDT